MQLSMLLSVQHFTDNRNPTPPLKHFFSSLLLILSSRMSFKGNVHSSFSDFNVVSLSGNINLSSDKLLVLRIESPPNTLPKPVAVTLVAVT